MLKKFGTMQPGVLIGQTSILKSCQTTSADTPISRLLTLKLKGGQRSMLTTINSRKFTLTRKKTSKLPGMVTLPSWQSTSQHKTFRPSIVISPTKSTMEAKDSPASSLISMLVVSTPLMVKEWTLRCILFIWHISQRLVTSSTQQWV